MFVIGNPKKDTNTTEITQKTNEKIEIPSIDSYWDNTPVKISQKEEIIPEQKEENILDKIVQQIVPPEPPKKQIPTAATISVTAPKATQTTKIQSKPKPITSSAPAQPKKTTQQTQKSNSSQGGMTFEDLTNKIRNQYPNQNQQTTTAKNHTTSTTNTTKTAPLPSQTSNQAKTVTQTPAITKNSSQATTITHTQSSQPIVQTPPAKSQAQLRQELATYKSGLRNTIGRKVDFTKVIGDGECSLSFKVNSSGRLISKAFTKQSSNITLNDAAFNALNTTTSYNPPPEGYKGETFKLTIKFYNGNFEISLN